MSVAGWRKCTGPGAACRTTGSRCVASVAVLTIRDERLIAIPLTEELSNISGSLPESVQLISKPVLKIN